MVKIHPDKNVADLLTKAFDDGDEAVHKELGDRMERAATTASSFKAEQDSDAQTRFEATSKLSYDPPLSRGYTLESGEDILKLQELMGHCTKLSKRIERYYELKTEREDFESQIGDGMLLERKLELILLGKVSTARLGNLNSLSIHQMESLEFCDKHNMVAYLEKSEGSEGFHEIINFLSRRHINYALSENPTLYVSLIEQFWQTAALNISEDGDKAITATIDGREKTIIEAFLRRHLKLADKDGISSLLNEEIFKHLTRIGSKKTTWDQFSSNLATAIICLATNRTFNFSHYIFNAMVKNVDNTHKFLMYPRFIQIVLNKQQRLLFPHVRTYTTPTLTHKLFNNMRRATKGYSGVVTPLFDTMLVQPQDAEPSTSPSIISSSPSMSPQTHQPSPSPQPMDTDSRYSTHLYSNPNADSNRMPLTKANEGKTKKVYGITYTKLVKRVKRLETKLKSTQARRRSRIILSKDEDVVRTSFDTELVEDIESGAKGEKEVSTANILVSTRGQYDSTYCRVMRISDMSCRSLVYIRRSVEKRKDKGKAIMQETKPPTQIKKMVQVQLSINEELAKKVQEEEQARAIA
ncbi:hypothetical protein Tco_0656016 [Tanacetum coccineum]|uniref:Uncharacterized protein n=1 Tax=Tanacetum coccineum TaxID=301880 RepID=A0ABQ4X7L5_9ASTR